MYLYIYISIRLENCKVEVCMYVHRYPYMQYVPYSITVYMHNVCLPRTTPMQTRTPVDVGRNDLFPFSCVRPPLVKNVG